MFVIAYFFGISETTPHYVGLWHMVRRSFSKNLSQYVAYVVPITVLTYVLALCWSAAFEMSSLNVERILVGIFLRRLKKQKVTLLTN